MVHQEVASQPVEQVDMVLLLNVEEGSDYVGTYGFSKIMRLHLWWRINRWRCHPGYGLASNSAGSQG